MEIQKILVMTLSNELKLDYSGVVDYDPKELIITAKCGTKISEIKSR